MGLKGSSSYDLVALGTRKVPKLALGDRIKICSQYSHIKAATGVVVEVLQSPYYKLKFDTSWAWTKSDTYSRIELVKLKDQSTKYSQNGFDAAKRKGERLRTLKPGDRVKVVNKISTTYGSKGTVVLRFNDPASTYTVKLDKNTMFPNGLNYLRIELKRLT